MEAAAQKLACPRCRGAGYLIQPQGDFAVASPCGCQRECRRCGGTGRTYAEKDGYRFLARCTCQRVETAVALYNGARLPAVQAGRDFDGIEPRFSVLETAVHITRDWCARYLPGKTQPSSLLFSGPVGTGKTHLLVAALHHLALEMLVPCRYVEISFLYSEIRNGFSQGRSSLDIIAPLSEVPVLAIDELGKGKASPFELETIDELIARRYNAGRATLFATNYAVTERRERGGFVGTGERLAEARAEQFLRERVGERVFSRLHQMCGRQLIEFPPDAEDYRRLSVRR